MSTDKTFFTNEPNSTLLDRFKATIKLAQYFDVLVGYFRITGFYRLYEELESVDKIRILVGLSIDKASFDVIENAKQTEFDMQSHAKARELAARKTIEELEQSDDKYDVEFGIIKFIEFLKSGKIEFRAYPTKNIHAKVYITRYKGDVAEVQKGSVITGSSNFSESGLVANREFNVELKNQSDLDFALNQFEELWSQSVDVSQDTIDAITKKTWLTDDISPYELYLKMLYEYFNEDINLDKQIELDLPDGFLDLEYQKQAIMAAKKILDAYNGVFLADVVGLGKTFISALLAQQLPGGKLIICPPVLKDYWDETLNSFHVSNFHVESLGKLDKIVAQLDLNPNKYKTIFIDEAHRFRNEYTKSFETLYKIAYGKKIVLISATPLNNRFNDILNQIKLFQPPKKSWIPGLPNLEDYFNDIQRSLHKLSKSDEEYSESIKNASAKIRDNVLKHIMVRRTRTEIKRHFSEDITSRGLFFPEVADPRRFIYVLNPSLNNTYMTTLDILSDFSYARYTPLRFIKKDKRKQYNIEEFDVQQQKNLGGFMKGILVKRLESSFYAFKKTVGRFIESYELFIDMYHKGAVLISKEVNVYDILGSDNIEEILSELGEDKVKNYDSSDFEEDFIKLLEQDLERLIDIRSKWNTVHEDPKLEEFIDQLKSNEELKSKKIIIFTESKETGEHIYKNLNEVFAGRVIFFSSKGGVTNNGNLSSNNARNTIKQNFDPNYKEPVDDLSFIVTTDILAEGINLHRSNIVVNYDLPWNPTRVLQRVGRVNRVGTDHEKIFIYNFFPTDQSEQEIHLEANIVSKIQAFHDTLGEDSKYLTEQEEVSVHNLFGDNLVKKLGDKKTYESESESEDRSELEYLKVIRDVRDNEPILFKRIRDLPKKSRSVLKTEVDQNELITFFRKDKLKKFIHNDGITPRELTFFQAVDKFKSDSEEKNIPIEKDYYDLLQDNKNYFDNLLMKDELKPTSARGRTNADRVLMRLKTKEFRTFEQFTDEDLTYIKKVIEKIQSGELPNNSLKRIKNKIEKTFDNQKVLMHLRQELDESIVYGTRSRIAPTNTAREIILSAYIKDK